MNSEGPTIRDFIQGNKEALVRASYVAMTTGVSMSFDPDKDIREEGHDLMSAALRIRQLLFDTGTTDAELNAMLDAIDAEDGLPPVESQA